MCFAAPKSPLVALYLPAVSHPNMVKDEMADGSNDITESTIDLAAIVRGQRSAVCTAGPVRWAALDQRCCVCLLDIRYHVRHVRCGVVSEIRD